MDTPIPLIGAGCGRFLGDARGQGLGARWGGCRRTGHVFRRWIAPNRGALAGFEVGHRAVQVWPGPISNARNTPVLLYQPHQAAHFLFVSGAGRSVGENAVDEGFVSGRCANFSDAKRGRLQSGRSKLFAAGDDSLHGLGSETGAGALRVALEDSI